MKKWFLPEGHDIPSFAFSKSCAHLLWLFLLFTTAVPVLQHRNTPQSLKLQKQTRKEAGRILTTCFGPNVNLPALESILPIWIPVGPLSLWDLDNRHCKIAVHCVLCLSREQGDGRRHRTNSSNEVLPLVSYFHFARKAISQKPPPDRTGHCSPSLTEWQTFIFVKLKATRTPTKLAKFITLFLNSKVRRVMFSLQLQPCCFHILSTRHVHGICL